MGPELPSRPKFSWDIRSVPWTDGKGNQEPYANVVSLWKDFHDNLPDTNSNKIPPELQGIMLQSQLYGRALDLTRTIPRDVIRSRDGVDAIVKEVFKRDPLAVVNEVFQDYLQLLSTRRGVTESFSNFETRFQAQASRLNSHSSKVQLPDALVSFGLLANAQVDGSQRISILAAAAPRGSEYKHARTTDDYLSAVSYSSISSVLRQCDTEKPRAVEPDSRRSLHGNSASTRFSRNNRHPQHRRKKTLTPEQLADLKSKSKCNKCQQIGHWASDHDPDGNYPPKDSTQQPVKHAPDQGKMPRNTISFNMAQVGNPTMEVSSFAGPLVDDAAPYIRSCISCSPMPEYSGMGEHEFLLLQPMLMPSWKHQYDPLPDSIAYRPYWQYGSGSHSSSSRKILGSVGFSATTDQGHQVFIRHLIIKVSSQWLIGRNVTKHCNILHMKENVIQLPPITPQAPSDTISLFDQDMHCYMPLHIFCSNSTEVNMIDSTRAFCATVHVSSASAVHPWSTLKRIIDKVHHHVCGHSHYENIKILLQRNKLWNDDCKKYLSYLLESCPSCHAVREPKGTRSVSLSAMSRDLNQVVCVDHLFVDLYKVFHAMDTVTRYSVGSPVSDVKMHSAISTFETLWITPFWTPESVLFDPAFKNSEFVGYLQQLGVNVRPIPPRRHNKNVLESKHRVIRDIFLRLKSACQEEDIDSPLLIVQAIRISNDLYGNDVMSAHELAKGYTRPITTSSFPVRVPDEVMQAHKDLLATRKLNLLLHSKAVRDVPIHVGDSVQVFIKQQNEKRGHWSSSKPVIQYDHPSRTVTVPGANGKAIRAAVEDVRAAIPRDTLAGFVQDAMDTMDRSLDETIHSLPDDDQDSPSPHSDMTHNVQFEGVNGPNPPSALTEEVNPEIGHQIPNPDNPDDQPLPLTETSLDPSDDPLLYVPPTAHQLRQEKLANPAQSTHQMKTRHGNKMHGHEVQLSPGTELSSQEKEATDLYYARFKNKEFLLSQAEGLPTSVTANAYKKEEEIFKKSVKEVHVSQVPKDANVITSHVLCKVKHLDDNSLMCKARIAPHGNKDRDKHLLRTDSQSCPPLGLRVLLSLCTIFQFFLTKIDIKSAFLQTGSALRDVYVVPPRECANRMFYWLLLTAAYGLVNANAKFQHHSDDFLNKLGFRQLIYIPQLFFKRIRDNMFLLAVKVVDDIIVSGKKEHLLEFVDEISQQYKLGTVVHSPGMFNYFGLMVTQEDDGTIHISADEKLQALEPFSLDRCRWKDVDDCLNAIESFSYASLNGSLGWIGNAVSPFCSLATSYLQQRRVSPTVKDMICQNNMLRSLKKLGSTIKYKRPPQSGDFNVSILVFSDAARSDDSGQLGFIAGLVIGNIKAGSVFHTIAWGSQRSKRPVKSIGSAETLAAGSVIDEGKVLVKAYEELLGVKVSLVVVVDSKDLFDSLSTCRNATDKSIRADVNLIRYEFETENINRMMWIPGKLNLADPLTKPDSPLCPALQLTMFSGELPVEFTSAVQRDSAQFLG